MHMIKIKDIKEGDIFYECQYGNNMGFIAIGNPYLKEEGTEFQGWAIMAKNKTQEIEFFHAEKFGVYAPKLYREPQYISRNSEGHIVQVVKWD